MYKYLYQLSLFIYFVTITNICLTFFEIYIENIFINVFYLTLLLFLLFWVIKDHLEISESIPYKTQKELSEMDIHKYFEHSQPKNQTQRPNELKLMVMGTGIYSFTVFIWRMVTKPNGSPIIKNNEYFERDHGILTSITKEQYYHLLNIENMMITLFPLVLSIIGIWKFYKYKK